MIVGATASVTSSATPAILVDVPRSPGSSIYDTVNVLGTVSGTGQSGITATSGTLSLSGNYYSNQQLALTVASGASVSGTTALALIQSAGNASGTVAATVDNAGVLTGTGGTALTGNVVSTANGYAASLASFTTINNRAGGSIVGGILGPVGMLTNAGSINGGGVSAVDTGSLSSSTTVTNVATGAIRSTSTGATISTGTGYQSITNAGIIANAGNGAALSGGLVVVTNQAGGRITSASATAIAASSALTLVNQGTIVGNVSTGNGASTVDSSAGTITGSVTFGSGSDTLIARYAGTRKLATGVTGTINAGGGFNTEMVAFTGNTSVTTPIDLDAGFQQLVFAPAAGITATLQSGFTTSSALILGGAGSVTNQAAIQSVNDGSDYSFNSVRLFANEGSITGGGSTNSYVVVDLH
ncbi:beta strand repeat-containing protein [uncultured Sphingomonas sp.]|uniref:beta strand repeat-containing protein n=1 Tax=uncultured Sphingomonas sp. TaxID=158754 RepID=UPI0035C9FAD2